MSKFAWKKTAEVGLVGKDAPMQPVHMPKVVPPRIAGNDFMQQLTEPAKVTGKTPAAASAENHASCAATNDSDDEYDMPPLNQVQTPAGLQRPSTANKHVPAQSALKSSTSPGSQNNVKEMPQKLARSSAAPDSGVPELAAILQAHVNRLGPSNNQQRANAGHDDVGGDSSDDEMPPIAAPVAGQTSRGALDERGDEDDMPPLNALTATGRAQARDNQDAAGKTRSSSNKVVHPAAVPRQAYDDVTSDESEEDGMPPLDMATKTAGQEAPLARTPAVQHYRVASDDSEAEDDMPPLNGQQKLAAQPSATTKQSADGRDAGKNSALPSQPMESPQHFQFNIASDDSDEEDDMPPLSTLSKANAPSRPDIADGSMPPVVAPASKQTHSSDASDDSADENDMPPLNRVPQAVEQAPATVRHDVRDNDNKNDEMPPTATVASKQARSNVSSGSEGDALPPLNKVQVAPCYEPGQRLSPATEGASKRTQGTPDESEDDDMPPLNVLPKADGSDMGKQPTAASATKMADDNENRENDIPPLSKVLVAAEQASATDKHHVGDTSSGRAKTTPPTTNPASKQIQEDDSSDESDDDDMPPLNMVSTAPVQASARVQPDATGKIQSHAAANGSQQHSADGSDDSSDDDMPPLAASEPSQVQGDATFPSPSTDRRDGQPSPPPSEQVSTGSSWLNEPSPLSGAASEAKAAATDVAPAQSTPPPPPATAMEEAMALLQRSGFKIGDEVMLVGLTSVSLNGERGKVVEPTEETTKGRLLVQLDVSGSALSVKPSNLKFCTSSSVKAPLAAKGALTIEEITPQADDSKNASATEDASGAADGKIDKQDDDSDGSMPPLGDIPDEVQGPVSEQAGSAAGWSAGDRVRIKDLPRARQMEGKLARVIGPAQGVLKRIPVELEENGLAVSVKAENLEAASEDEEDKKQPKVAAAAAKKASIKDEVSSVPHEESAEAQGESTEAPSAARDALGKSDTDDSLPPLAFIESGSPYYRTNAASDSEDQDDGELVPGDLVELFDLKTSQLNGERGRVVHLPSGCSKTPRVEVKMISTGKTLSVKKANVRWVEDDDELAPMQSKKKRALRQGDTVVLKALSAMEYNGQKALVHTAPSGTSKKERVFVQLLATGQLLSLREDKVQLMDSDSSEDDMPPSMSKSIVGDKQADSKDKDGKTNRGKFHVGQKLWLQKRNNPQYDGMEVFVLPSDPLKVLEDQVTVQLPTGKRIVVKDSQLTTVPPNKPKKRKTKCKTPKANEEAPGLEATPAAEEGAAQPDAVHPQAAAAVASPVAAIPVRRSQESPAVAAATSERRLEEKVPQPTAPAAAVPAASAAPKAAAVPAVAVPASSAAPKAAAASAAALPAASSTPKVAAVPAAAVPAASPAAVPAAAVPAAPTAQRTDSIEEWCKDNGICDELIARLQDEEVETAEDLACIMDEDLNVIAHGIKIGKKGKLLNAVRKLRLALGIERAPRESGES
eukprot:TRINITY_DN103752_c0_g1_i1.p1 TRINITY_DN103752_c0_g1~~TRINITY_DN103752_c0_g1_i1.p1  ORF type:complete len:1474 (-),score=438.56 TRINITY_DN103752_c0_g1_i1:127-4548(-)